MGCILIKGLKMKIIDKVLVGWGKVEAPIIACAALKKNVLLISRHGTGKTTLGRFLGQALSGDTKSFAFYPADKCNEFDICGFPNIEASKQSGQNSYIKSSQTIWNKKVIVIDELSRAPRDNQNLWLEILEENTARGNPIPLEMAIATANPITYTGTFQLDAALQDRFWAVINAPDLMGTELEEEILIEVINKNLVRKDSEEEIAASFRELINSTRANYDSLLKDEKISNRVKMFVSKLLAVVLKYTAKDKQNTFYISPRNCVQLFHMVLACSAYFKTTGEEFWLEEGAKSATQFNLIIKNGIELAKVIEPVLNDLLMLLSDAETGFIKFKIQLRFTTPEQICQLIKDNIDQFKQMPQHEQSQILEITSQKLTNKPARLWELRSLLKSNGTTAIKTEAMLALAVQRSAGSFKDLFEINENIINSFSS